MIKLTDILKETGMDIEDFIIQTAVPKGKTIEYFRFIATSPGGNEIRTGWYPFRNDVVKSTQRDLESNMYKILKMEKKTETA